MSDTTQIIILAVLVAFTVAAIAFGIFGRSISQKETATNRVRKFSGAMADKSKGKSDKHDPQQARRRHVQSQLKKLEDDIQSTKKKKVTIEQRIERAGLKVSPMVVRVGGVIVGLLVGALLLLSGYSPIACGLTAFAVGLGLPRWVLNFLFKRRVKSFTTEFVSAIDIIVRGIKSGLPVNECFNVIASETRDPVRSEFEFLIRNQKMGVTVEQSLDKIYERVPTAEVSFFSIVLVIQKQTGGNLAEALTNLSSVLRDRKKMKGKIQAMSSEAKSSAGIIGSLPFLVGTMVFFVSPGYLDVLVTETVGNVMLLGGALWMSMGIMVMRKMINFDI